MKSRKTEKYFLIIGTNGTTIQMVKSFESVPLISTTIALLRNKETPPPDFRKGLFQLGRYLAYEISKFLPVEKRVVESPFSKAEYVHVVDRDLVILGVLRASLPMLEGVFEEFPEARIGFLSASRGHMLEENGKNFEIHTLYAKIPDVHNKTVLVVDPMLASASTLLKVIEKLSESNPAKIIIVSAIGTEYGINRIKNKYPLVEIIIGIVDPVLNERGYIIPGL